MLTLFRDPFNSIFDEVLDTQGFFKTPQINIRKIDNEYKLLMSVPGLTKEDIKISTKEGVLTISYKKEEKDDKTQFVSSFYKTYTLPEDAKEEHIKGKVENGVLELTIPTDRKKSIERLISLN